jgi:hypothetical protein
VPIAAASPYSPERIMIGAGVVAGLLPLAHAHTFVTVMGMGAIFALMTRRWRLWILFALVASVLALPQGLWAISGTSAKAATFFGWHFGWSGHELRDKWVSDWHEIGILKTWWQNAAIRPWLSKALYGIAIAWYWFLNTSILIPLVIAATLWKRGGRIVRRPLRLAFLPFWLCFIVPNLTKLAPWEWDNIKVLIYWFIPAVPLVALLLVRLSRWGALGKPLAAAFFVLMTLSGALDIWRAWTGALQWCVFDNDQMAVGDFIRTVTPARAVLLTAPVHNHPFLLSGRRSFLGYTGTLWTHGIEYGEREEAMKKIYKGEPEAVDLLKQHRIDYVVVGPLEDTSPGQINREFFEKTFSRMGEVRGTVIYKVS